MSPLYHNEDCTNFFGNHDTTGGKGGAAVDAYVDVIAGAGVTTLLCNTNAQLANYGSDAWQTFWEGFDPDGPDDQPFLAGVAAAGEVVSVAGWRRLVTNMLALHEEGIDYPARVIERCRCRGLAPWVSIRMNDVHSNGNVSHPIHSDFWRRSPHLYRQGIEGYFAQAFDFAHAEVRDYYAGLIRETLERYDIDGLELDFLREPYLFSRGQEEAGTEILTQWVGEIREWVEARARERGHGIQLGARVPAQHRVGVALGIDAVEWARQGLVDLVVVAPRWSTIDFDLPMREWRRRLEPHGVALAGGLEILLGPHPLAPKRPVTAAEARGAAAQVLHGGADSVYLFNYFQDTDPDSVPDRWPGERYQQTLRSLSSLSEICRHPRCHALTFVDVTGPEDQPLVQPPLPAEGTDLVFHLPTGPAPPAAAAQLLLGLEGECRASAPVPAVTVNGSPELVFLEEEGEGELRRLRYELSPEALQVEAGNEVRVVSEEAHSLRVGALSICLYPDGG